VQLGGGTMKHLDDCQRIGSSHQFSFLEQYQIGMGQSTKKIVKFFCKQCLVMLTINTSDNVVLEQTPPPHYPDKLKY
jgi:hypothetical protein